MLQRSVKKENDLLPTENLEDKKRDTGKRTYKQFNINNLSTLNMSRAKLLTPIK